MIFMTRSWVSLMKFLTMLMAIVTTMTLATETNQGKAGSELCAGESCVVDHSSSGRSMLNLGVRVRSKADVKVEENLQALTMGNGSSAQTGLADTTHTSELRVLLEKPNPTGLPGDIVVTTVTVKCGDDLFAPMGSCPDDCPYFTSIPGKSCHFKCVAASGCGQVDPEERVPDRDYNVCRECNVQGCAECSPYQIDSCVTCAKGYKLENDGTCSSDYAKVWKYIIIFLSVVFAFLLIWLTQLACAPITNRDGLREGLKHRSGLKLHVPISDEDPSEERDLFPISTNLHVTQVAGPGLTLHMNFQLASIMWACTLIVCWLIFVYTTEVRQLTIGLYPSDTKPELCFVTLQGRALQEEQMPYKVAFIFIVYVITFGGSVFYAILNERVYTTIDDEAGMEDFVAVCVGLPIIKGSDRNVEADLKTCLQTNTGENVVGVSIAWDYAQKAEDVQDIVERDMISREPFEQPSPDPDVYDSRGPMQRRIFDPVDNLVGGVLGLTVPDPDVEEDYSIDSEAVVEMLEDLSTTKTAFVVFETQDARDRAVTTMRGKQVVAFRGGSLRLKRKSCVPKVLIWENFDVHWSKMTARIFVGMVAILVALVVYSVCFYAPFAYYQSMFKFPNEPSMVDTTIFSMLVVAGNQIMYQICAAISDGAGFHYRDDAEALYVALYVLAVLLSVAFDMAVECYLGYHSMADAGVKTADGRSLDQISSYQMIFESYPMQKVLGKRLFDYCFPATFLVPFLAEPIGTVVAPFTIQKWLLRTHPEVRGRNAEKSVDFFAPLDMGRYGDILLNLWLVTLLLFFPSGTILPILFAYVVSHIYIYAYDQYKILRCVPTFAYGSDVIDKYAQLMLILPCSTLAAILVFKTNCISTTLFCYAGFDLAVNMAIAFTAHAFLHLFILLVICPLISSMHQHKKIKETYEQVSSKEPCNWFNSNPVHCLRSEFIHKDKPSCCFWVQGKEHLIRKNPKIGQHFENSRRVKAEDYD